MSRVLVLSGDRSATDVLPALGLLSHPTTMAPPVVQSLLDAPPVDVVLVDGRRDLLAARSLCRQLAAAGDSAAIVAVVTEAGFAAVSRDWAVDEVIAESGGPAEVDARLRLAIERRAAGPASTAGAVGDARGGPVPAGELRAGELAVDEPSYTVRLRGQPLDLTFKEFELLRHLVRHPGRVFTRARLLDEVWGYDYYGGTRTVDVHVRRLRAKLGPEHEALIGTVRGVGYRFTAPEAARSEPASDGVGQQPGGWAGGRGGAGRGPAERGDNGPGERGGNGPAERGDNGPGERGAGGEAEGGSAGGRAGEVGAASAGRRG